MEGGEISNKLSPENVITRQKIVIFLPFLALFTLLDMVIWLATSNPFLVMIAIACEPVVISKITPPISIF
ncbi:MAG: hypothetical protein U9N41_04050 [Euryarchaeota archaeon]|nr:hypothetical protein [Euryarchaeota archaeon]